jgi:hypothetical protein
VKARKLILISVTAAALVLAGYVAAVWRNAWVQTMGGVGLGQMTHQTYPAHCAGLVDLHRGKGNAPGFNDLRLGPRTFILDVRLLRESPECLGHSILGPEGLGSEADYRLIFIDVSKKTVVEVTANYPKESAK